MEHTFLCTVGAAWRGDADAQHNLSMWYLNGEDGFAVDRAQAVRWAQRAAAQSHAQAQQRLQSLTRPCEPVQPLRVFEWCTFEMLSLL